MRFLPLFFVLISFHLRDQKPVKALHVILGCQITSSLEQCEVVIKRCTSVREQLSIHSLSQMWFSVNPSAETLLIIQIQPTTQCEIKSAHDEGASCRCSGLSLPFLNMLIMTLPDCLSACCRWHRRPRQSVKPELNYMIKNKKRLKKPSSEANNYMTGYDIRERRKPLTSSSQFLLTFIKHGQDQKTNLPRVVRLLLNPLSTETWY